MALSRTQIARLEKLESAKIGTGGPYQFVFLEHGETLREVIDRDFGGVAPPNIIAVKWVEADNGRVAPGYVPAGSL